MLCSTPEGLRQTSTNLSQNEACHEVIFLSSSERTVYICDGKFLTAQATCGAFASLPLMARHCVSHLPVFVTLCVLMTLAIWVAPACKFIVDTEGNQKYSHGTGASGLAA